MSYLTSALLALTGVAFVAAPAHAAITGSFSSGVLTVSSDAAGDQMIFTCGAQGVPVNGIEPTGSTVACTNQLVVLGNGGDGVIDTVALTGTSLAGITVDAGDGNDRVTGGGFTTGNTNQVSIAGGAGMT